jgi:uncharacterized protein YecT (DUF1311 family)
MLRDVYGCQSKDYVDKLSTISYQRDQDAFASALLEGVGSGECVVFNKGDIVYVMDTSIWSGYIKVRKKGESSEYWTFFDSVIASEDKTKSAPPATLDAASQPEHQVATPAAISPAAPMTVTGISGNGPSFDCNKAKSQAELIICGDTELSNRDVALSDLYQKAKSAASDKQAFNLQSKLEWRLRETQCKDRNCLISWYDKRSTQLNQIIVSGLVQ